MEKVLATLVTAATLWCPAQVTYTAPPVLTEEPPQTVLPLSLKRICSCESTGSPDNEPVQFNADGSVLRGRINSQDVGMCQINEYYWLEKSIELGFDIHTEEGNKQMALWIYNDQGVKPWVWSAGCHGQR